jgi:hypothetical protein
MDPRYGNYNNMDPRYGGMGGMNPGFGGMGNALGMNQPFGNTSPFPAPPERPQYGSNYKSVILDTLVAAGSGRVDRVDLSILGTDAGASENAQRVLRMAGAINSDLRGQYTLGYYTSKEGSFAERGLVVKTAAAEGAEVFTVSIEPPKIPELVTAPAAPAKVDEKAAAAAKGKEADKAKNDKDNNNEKK